MLRLRLFCIWGSDVYLTLLGGRTLRELHAGHATHINKVVRRVLLLLGGSLLWAGRARIRPSVGPITGLLVGFAAGLRLQRRYWRIRRLRERLQQVLLSELEEEQLEFLMHQVPYWISIQEYERVMWLNKTVKLMWPHYASALSRLTIQALEPILNRHKPKFISSISVDKFSLGEIPFDIQKVRLVSNRTQDLTLEAAIRWNAQDAQVALVIAPLRGVTLIPKLRKIHMYATVRVVLRPLVPKIPCFGAIAVALKQPPLVNFELDFGMLDIAQVTSRQFGKVVSISQVVPIAPRSLAMARYVEAWLKPFLVNDVLGNLLVWPNRIVIPIMPESVTGPLDDLRLSTRGILRVTAVEARGLKTMQTGWWGAPDPVVVLHISPLDKEKTRGQGNTLDPVWNQQLFFKVQEQSLPLYVEVRDGDEEVVDPSSSHPGEKDANYDVLLGRAIVPVVDLCPGIETDAWYTLGTGDISGDIGPGGGAGRIRLKLCYWPLEMLKQQFGAWAAGPQRGSAEWSQEERISQCESVVTARAISEQQLHVRRPRVSRNKRGQRYNQSVASLPRSRLGAPSEAGSAPTYPGRATQPRRRCHAAHPGPLVASHVSPEAAARPVYAPTPIPNGDERPPQRGVLFLLLVGAVNVPKMDMGPCDPVVRLHVAGQKRESRCAVNTQSPVWNERFDFFNIEATARILVKLYDATYVGKWKIGNMVIPLARVANSPNGVLRDSFAFPSATVPSDCRITISMEWVPLDGNRVPAWVPSPQDGTTGSDAVARFATDQPSGSANEAGRRVLIPTKSLLRASHQQALARAFAGVAPAVHDMGTSISTSGSIEPGFLATWLETSSQLAPTDSHWAAHAARSRLSVRITGCTMSHARVGLFCELRLTRNSPRFSETKTNPTPSWDEQFCWQGVRESDNLTVTLMQQGLLWNEKLGVVKISLREIWGAPGNALVGSWRLSDCRDDIEVTMELIWWEATSEAGLRQGFESSDSISSSLRDEDFTGIEFESDGNASARALDRHGIPTDVKSLASTSTGVR